MDTALHRLLALLRRPWIRLRALGRREVTLLVVALVAVVCTYLFIELADEVKQGDTQRFDEWAIRSLRRVDDPAVPIGPHWLREAGLDASALGSPLVLVLVVTAVLGFLLLERRYGMMWLTLFTTAVGLLLNVGLKGDIRRDRPGVVPRLQEVTSPSFPSGHAMLSAIVYLTLGILLTQVIPGRLGKLYCLLWALFLTFLVGLSRVYLGVHYPTDVLAGWMAGLVWALVCWAVAQYLRRQGQIEAE